VTPSVHRTLDVDLPTHTVRALTWGPEDGPLVVALHGFPDTAHTWRHLGPTLAGHGWRVVAPFLRGYGPSGIPSDNVYTVGSLMADAAALHTLLGGDERSVVVGHDWGAFTASGLGANPDSPFAKVVTLAVPPLPTIYPSRRLWRLWLSAVVRQPRNSWYVVANQIPGLSERHFERLVRKLWRDWSPGYEASEDLRLLRESVPDVEHARAVISYYRALLRPGSAAKVYTSWASTWTAMPVVPTLVLQGDQDGSFDRRFIDLAIAALSGDSRAVAVPGTGHFLQLEAPDVVNGLITDFLGPAA
jgi:pimeloyl-ACP methyl ester carboxylesterase